MTPEQWDRSIVAGLIGAGTAIVGAVLTYRVRLKGIELSNWEKLNAAHTAYRQEIHAELDKTKKERDELRARIDHLETHVRSLIEQNERIMVDKLDWMRRATNMQLLLQKAMKSIPFDTAEPLHRWFRKEIEQIESEAAHEVANGEAGKEEG